MHQGFFFYFTFAPKLVRYPIQKTHCVTPTKFQIAADSDVLSEF